MMMMMILVTREGKDDRGPWTAIVVDIFCFTEDLNGMDLAAFLTIVVEVMVIITVRHRHLVDIGICVCSFEKIVPIG